MRHGIEISLIDRITPLVRELATARARALPHLVHADVRVEVSEGKYAGAENGSAKSSGDDYTFSFGIRVLAGDRMVAPGYFGRGMGTADLGRLEQLLTEGLLSAYRRAMANGEHKAAAREKFGSLGEALADTRLHPVRVSQEIVPARFEIDPREMSLDEMVRFSTDVSRRVGASNGQVQYNYVATLTQLSRELFASSEGAL